MLSEIGQTRKDLYCVTHLQEVLEPPDSVRQSRMEVAGAE